jgi:hypothetical protein
LTASVSRTARLPAALTENSPQRRSRQKNRPIDASPHNNAKNTATA